MPQHDRLLPVVQLLAESPVTDDEVLEHLRVKCIEIEARSLPIDRIEAAIGEGSIRMERIAEAVSRESCPIICEQRRSIRTS